MISNFEIDNMEGYTVKVRTCNLKKNFMTPFYGWGSTASRLEPVRGGSQIHSCYIHLRISKLTSKSEYAKHLLRNITFSKVAGQDNNITGQTAPEQIFERTPFPAIVSTQGYRGHGKQGVGGYTPLTH